MVQHNTVLGSECLCHWANWLKEGFTKDVQDLGINMVKEEPSGAVLVTEVVPASYYLFHPESNSWQCMCVVFEACLYVLVDLVGV
jgi:hypothetical protein